MTRSGDAGTAPDGDLATEASIDDLDELLECWVALIEHGREYGLHIRSDANRTIARESLAAAIADDLAFVSRDGEAIAGFCTMTVESGGFERDVVRGVVENLYVEPDARGDGRGSALLAAGERRLRERGVDAIAVETMVADEDVREFYAERGYRPQRLTAEKRVETNR